MVNVLLLPESDIPVLDSTMELADNSSDEDFAVRSSRNMLHPRYRNKD